MFQHRFSNGPPPPYDRVLVLAGLVRTMRVHYLEVLYGCSAGRVVSLDAVARECRNANLTLAHVALKLACKGCTIARMKCT